MRVDGRGATVREGRGPGPCQMVGSPFSVAISIDSERLASMSTALAGQSRRQGAHAVELEATSSGIDENVFR